MDGTGDLAFRETDVGLSLNRTMPRRIHIDSGIQKDRGTRAAFLSQPRIELLTTGRSRAGWRDERQDWRPANKSPKNAVAMRSGRQFFPGKFVAPIRGNHDIGSRRLDDLVQAADMGRLAYEGTARRRAGIPRVEPVIDVDKMRAGDCGLSNI